MKLVQKDQRGFTLLELLVALPIAALVVAATTGAIFQVSNSTRASNYMFAYRQVQTSGYWVSHDAIQAQTITTGPNAGFPLVLSWTDWDDNDVHVVDYSLQDMSSGDLDYVQRKEILNGDVGNPIITVVSEYIDPNNSSFAPISHELASGETLTFTVKAQVGQQNATRTYEIKPRPLP